MQPRTRVRNTKKFSVTPGLNMASSDIALGPTHTTYLRYEDSIDQRSNSGSNYAVFALSLNDVYDPDPLILTGGITGYAEMVAFYSKWIVTHTNVRATITNRESFPLKVCYVVTPNSLVPTISSRTLAVDACERWGTYRTIELSAQGGMDRHDVTFNVDPAIVYGNVDEYRGSGAFAGATTTSPTKNVWLNIILIAPSTIASISNGIFHTLSISYKTKFYSISAKLLALPKLKREDSSSKKELQKQKILSALDMD